MLREFTQPIGRYKQGEVHDYPRTTWNQLAHNAKAKLESFTKAISIDTHLQNPLRGPVRIRKRLGTA